MIEAQIERLSLEEQRALESASVVGTTFAVDIGAAAADLGEEEFEDICDRLSRQHRIVRVGGVRALPEASDSPRYEFVHAMYREVFYHRQAPKRRSKRHRRIDDRLQALSSLRLSDSAAEAADHSERGAEWPRAGDRRSTERVGAAD